ncbi:hypothetical protein PS903_06201 [Pseudomonas fluorescens]|nr:hypothetical protein PS903_06201 [Pseudomonas fluorescens]
MRQRTAVSRAHVGGVLFGALGADALRRQAADGQLGQPQARLPVMVIHKPGAAVRALEVQAAVGKQRAVALFDLLVVRRRRGVEPGVHRREVDVFADLGTEVMVVEVGLLLGAVFTHEKFCFGVQIGRDKGPHRGDDGVNTRIARGGFARRGLAAVLTGLGFCLELLIEPMLGLEHHLALLGREADVTVFVAVAERAGQLGAVFADQAAHKPTDAQAQVVGLDPLFVARLH